MIMITDHTKYQILAISGKIGSGKNSLTDLIIKHSSLEFNETAFAKKLKQITALLASVSYETTLTQEGKNVFISEFDMTVGEILQKIGTNAMRDNFNKDVWIKSCFLEIKNNPGNWIITDCRFKNEAEALKDMGAKVLRIERPKNSTAENSSRDLNHLSETELDNYANFDYVINNDGSLEDLENKVIEMINFFKI